MTYVRVPEECWREVCPLVFGVLVCVDNVNVVEVSSLRYSCGGMLVQRPEVLPKFTLSIDIEIGLVAEEDNSANGNQTREIILLGISEVRQVNAFNLSAYLRIIVEDVRSGIEEIAELGMT